ncbi:MAG: hypothetical protein FWD48_10815 [Oscillospiraceae bacterium]|nr:hypothetical protein [Oscillospiraceae bacterium]
MKRRQPLSVGITSLFAVLIILCLTVFAVLARLSAQSERGLAERAAEAVSAYYDAESRAVSRLSEQVTSGSFTEEIDENRSLRVTFRITEDGRFIDEWAVVSSVDEPAPDINKNNESIIMTFEED